MFLSIVINQWKSLSAVFLRCYFRVAVICPPAAFWSRVAQYWIPLTYLVLCVCVQLIQRTCRSPVRRVGSRSNAACPWRFTPCSTRERSPSSVRFEHLLYIAAALHFTRTKSFYSNWDIHHFESCILHNVESSISLLILPSARKLKSPNDMVHLILLLSQYVLQKHSLSQLRFKIHLSQERLTWVFFLFCFLYFRTVVSASSTNTSCVPTWASTSDTSSSCVSGAERTSTWNSTLTNTWRHTLVSHRVVLRSSRGCSRLCWYWTTVEQRVLKAAVTDFFSFLFFRPLGGVAEECF